jgi:drug/metabolite transporter (DMT)-like permease
VPPVNGWIAVIYLGVCCTCAAYFIQTWALKYSTPAKAAIIISTESLFGSFFSILLGYEGLTVTLMAGGVLIVSSVLITEINFKNK